MLRHVFPGADIPIVQLSIDETQPLQFHYEIGKRLAPLREDGVLVIGSVNIVHNLHTYTWGKQGVHPFDWAVRFEKHAREFLLKGDDAPLIAYEKLGRNAMLSIPTQDHYLPLLYVMAFRRKGEQEKEPKKEWWMQYDKNRPAHPELLQREQPQKPLIWPKSWSERGMRYRSNGPKT